MPELSLKIGKYGISTGFGGGRGLFFKAGLPMASNAAASSRYGSNSWFYGLLPGADKDYYREAGDAWKNGIVSAALSWINRNLPYASLAVYTEDAKGEETIVPRHPLAGLLKRPNKYYDGRTLLQATFLSLIAGRGNAYWWVKRDNGGRPLEFWYLPHFECWPVWDRNATTDDWIARYAYRQQGITYFLRNEDVIHFRDGLDPENPRLGLDSLKAGARELVTDNAAAGWAAQLLENMAIPGLLIHPKGEGVLDQEQIDFLKAQFEARSGGENRFRPMALSGDVDVKNLAFSPQEMLLDTVQNRPEARLLAMIGLSPMVLGLTIGLEHSTYSNMETAEKAAWYNCVMPRIALICSELDVQALASYGPEAENMYLAGDYRKVPALQDNLDEKYKRITAAVGGAWLTPNEGRAQAGYDEIEGGDELARKPEPVDAQNPNSGNAARNGKALIAA